MSKELIKRIREKKRNATDEEDDAADALEAQQRELRVKDATIGQMANDMAAAQAQIKVLREALEQIESATMSMYATRSDLVDDLQSVAYKALATPTDDSALREMLKAERERCAKVADEWQTAIHDPRYQCDCAAAIRAMEDQ